MDDYDALHPDDTNITDEAETRVFCHISGKHQPSVSVKAARIVPYNYLDDQLALRHLFGDMERSKGVEIFSKFLMMSVQLASWFAKYQFVIVPVDPLKMPTITRWKVEVLSPDIKNMTVAALVKFLGHEPKVWEHLEGRELVFFEPTSPRSTVLVFQIYRPHPNQGAQQEGLGRGLGQVLRVQAFRNPRKVLPTTN